MPDIYNQALFHWRDFNGKTAVSFLTTQNQGAGGAGAYSALAAAAQACCDAAIVAIQFQTTLVVGTMPATGPYGTVWDRGVLLGRNAVTNAPQRQALVGPKSAIFKPDHITIDLTNPQVIAFQAAAEAVLGDSLGNAIGPFLRGARQKAGGS